MKTKIDQNLMADKEYRRKLYEENKELYKKVKSDFTYGVSSYFRQRKKNSKNEMEQLEEETREAYEEEK